ncbi:DMT family transporter [Ferrovibrio sp.]|uniref:DMT family transporter n=1 Tax=Ferrovibrio sp. TaxID=1917215 RepID=UPI0025C29CBE|nr:DMT family transporter [Ferrovibrio sp.]MBX3455716.1 DMT family transporter [Ferrovibrio sp.]
MADNRFNPGFGAIRLLVSGMRLQHIALLILICAIWGFNFVVAKVAVGHFPPVFVTGLRFLGLGLLLLPWLKWQRGQMTLVFQIALLMGALHFALMFTGIKLADDVSVVAVITQLGVPMATLMAWGLLGETVRWRRGVGIALAFAGSLVMGFDPKVFGYIGALVILIISVASMSLGQVLVRRIRSVDAFTMQAWIGAVSAPSLLLISFIFESGQWESVRTAGWLEWGGVAYMSIAVSLIGHGSFYYLLRIYPVAVVNPGFTLAPVLGVAFGVMFLDERLGMGAIVGAVMTIVGVFIVTLRESQLASVRAGEVPIAVQPGPVVKPSPVIKPSAD